MIKNKNLVFSYAGDSSSDADKVFQLPKITTSYLPTASGFEGCMVYDTTTNTVKWSDGVVWRGSFESASISPSISPSISASISPSRSPSISPSISSSGSPSISPSLSPSISPSLSPSISPSVSPSISPS